MSISKLAKALQKHYKREGSKVLFNNGQSLNQLAFTMWELLGYQQIDASVLSRVLKGERLFTTSQLKIFCKILKVNKIDEENLFHSLSSDYNIKKNIHIDSFLLQPSIAHEVIANLLENSFKTLFEGNCNELENKCDLIENLLDSSTPRYKNDKKLDELIALNVYLRGRIIGSIGLPDTVIKETAILAQKLLEISERNNNKTLYGYAHVLLSTAYYVAGGYSTAEDKANLYRHAIDLGRKALAALADDDSEKLFALRTIAASAIFLNDRETIMSVYTKTKEILYMQPFANRVNALHLCGTIANGLAIANDANPFAIKESAINHFKDDLSNTGIYEISDIKAELETLLALKTGDKNYILSRIKRGMDIADQHNFIRHKKYLENIYKPL